MDVVGAKILAGFLFFFVTLTFGFLPYLCLRRYSDAAGSSGRQSLIFQCLHTLASGVLLSTSLLTLLPESLRQVRKAISLQNKQQIRETIQTNITTNFTDIGILALSKEQAETDEDNFPVGESMVGLGFLFIFVIDNFIRSFSKKDYSLGSGSGEDSPFIIENDTERAANQCTTKLLQDSDISHGKLGQRETVLRRISKEAFELSSLKSGSRKLAHGVGDNNSQTVTNGHVDFETDLEIDGKSGSELQNNFEISRAIESHPLAFITKRVSTDTTHLKLVTLVCALCIHGFFDGVMLGLQTSLPVIMSLTLALSLHKTFVAIGLSLTLLTSSDNKTSCNIILLYVLIFAAASPVGLVFSSVFVQKTFTGRISSQVSVVPGCLQAFAVGTFLHVILTEMAKPKKQRWLAAVILSNVSLLFGFGVMAGLQAVV